jgi:hypothetical protein
VTISAWCVLRRIFIDDSTQDLPFIRTFQTFRITRARVIDEIAVIANTIGIIVQTITIARLQSLLLTVDGSFASFGFGRLWRCDWIDRRRWFGLIRLFRLIGL